MKAVLDLLKDKTNNIVVGDNPATKDQIVTLKKCGLYNIIKEYNGELPLYHMDVYRLDGNTDGVGIEEYFNKGGIVIIEWAKTIKDILPEERLEIKFKVVDENRRMLLITPYGQKYEELCEAVL